MKRWGDVSRGIEAWPRPTPAAHEQRQTTTNPQSQLTFLPVSGRTPDMQSHTRTFRYAGLGGQLLVGN